MNYFKGNNHAYTVAALKMKGCFVEETTRFNLSNTLKTDYSFRLITVGGRSIFIAVRDLWNAIPENLRNIASFSCFKSHLKTFLFKEAYGC